MEVPPIIHAPPSIVLHGDPKTRKPPFRRRTAHKQEQRHDLPLWLSHAVIQLSMIYTFLICVLALLQESVLHFSIRTVTFLVVPLQLLCVVAVAFYEGVSYRRHDKRHIVLSHTESLRHERVRIALWSNVLLSSAADVIILWVAQVCDDVDAEASGVRATGLDTAVNRHLEISHICLIAMAVPLALLFLVYVQWPAALKPPVYSQHQDDDDDDLNDIGATAVTTDDEDTTTDDEKPSAETAKPFGDWL